MKYVNVGKMQGSASLIITFIDTLFGPGALFDGKESTVLGIFDGGTTWNENLSIWIVSTLKGIWLTDWLTDGCLIDWLLIDWFITYSLPHSLIDWLTDWLIDSLTGKSW